MNGQPHDVRRRRTSGPIEPAPPAPSAWPAIEGWLNGFLASAIAGYIVWQVLIR